VTEPFVPLLDLPALESALDRARREPILLFKHSPTCGISAQAYHDVADWYATTRATVPLFVVDVRRHRPVSDAIASRFGIRHESPQVLLVAGDAVRWHGSHWHVNGREVQQALDAAQTSPAAR